MPSYVSFTSSDRLVGHPAKNLAALNPTNTVFDSKRLIGRRYDDPLVQNDMKMWPFAVIPSPSTDSQQPALMVTHKGQPETYTPEQISSFILAQLKSQAEAYLQSPVTDAVITVPAYFSDAQRQATKDAGRLAGLNVLRIINEPTAAAIAYGLENTKQDPLLDIKTASSYSSSSPSPSPSSSSSSPSSSSSSSHRGKSSEKHILIFDLGGGTFDVSLLSMENGIFEVKATAGDTHLGGEDFDDAIMNWVIEQIETQRKKGGATTTTDEEEEDIDLRHDDRLIRRLRTACEAAKRELSHKNSSLLTFTNLFPSLPDFPSSFQLILTRTIFETLCLTLFNSTLLPVEQVLRDSKIHKDQIDEIVLVGGSTRIPYIQDLLSKFFDNKELNSSIDPDEAVAYGATIQSAILMGIVHPSISHILLIDVAPLSMGIEIMGGIMSPLINRNSTIPCYRTQIFSTSIDKQESVLIQVYEGERTKTKNNLLLGNFELTGLPLLPRGQPQIKVTFNIDVNGILNVSAEEISTGNKNSLLVSSNKGRLSDEEIKKILYDANEYKNEDKEIQEREENRLGLYNYISQVEQKLRDGRFEKEMEKITDKENCNSNSNKNKNNNSNSYNGGGVGRKSKNKIGGGGGGGKNKKEEEEEWVSEEEYERVMKNIEQVRQWMTEKEQEEEEEKKGDGERREENERTIMVVKAIDYEEKQREIENMIMPLMAKIGIRRVQQWVAEEKEEAKEQC